MQRPLLFAGQALYQVARAIGLAVQGLGLFFAYVVLDPITLLIVMALGLFLLSA